MKLQNAGFCCRPLRSETPSGAVTLLKPQTNDKFSSTSKMGRGDLALQGLDIVELLINPHAMLMEPCVELLARELKARVDRLTAGDSIGSGRG